jgi:hypothetical protein
VDTQSLLVAADRFIWKIHKWLPVALAMSRMLRELTAAPDSGFLGVESWIGNPTIALQYWRSVEQLEVYAKDSVRLHRPAWAAFNRAVANNGDVGIWHETYRVRPGDFESIYNNMPPFGLAKATTAVSAKANSTPPCPDGLAAMMWRMICVRLTRRSTDAPWAARPWVAGA